MSLDMNLYHNQTYPYVEEKGIRRFIDEDSNWEHLSLLVYEAAKYVFSNALENDDLEGYEDRFTQEIERVIWALEIVKNEGWRYLDIKDRSNPID